MWTRANRVLGLCYSSSRLVVGGVAANSAPINHRPTTRTGGPSASSLGRRPVAQPSRRWQLQSRSRVKLEAKYAPMHREWALCLVMAGVTPGIRHRYPSVPGKNVIVTPGITACARRQVLIATSMASVWRWLRRRRPPLTRWRRRLPSRRRTRRSSGCGTSSDYGGSSCRQAGRERRERARGSIGEVA